MLKPHGTDQRVLNQYFKGMCEGYSVLYVGPLLVFVVVVLFEEPFEFRRIEVGSNPKQMI